MKATGLAAALADALLGLQVGATTGAAANDRIGVQGIALVRDADGTVVVTVRTLEASSLHIASGPLAPPVNPPVVSSGTAATLPADGAWLLAPLAAANGTIRAEIVDAHLLFDADVTVPIRQGQIDFNDATVEHVGPDSRMGVSRMGIYVDAANGRSYLLQFPNTPVAGVEFERRGALPGPWAADRGKLQLQPFAEGMLRQGLGDPMQGVTGQARLLLDRTSVSGEVRLGDGKFAAPGVQAELAGRAEGRNVVRLHSGAVGRGLKLEVVSLRILRAALDLGDGQLACDELTAAFSVEFIVEAGQLRLAFHLVQLKALGLRLEWRQPPQKNDRA